MKDWDFDREISSLKGHYEHDIKMNLQPISCHDARAGVPKLSTVECDEINRKCDEFFRKRNMPVGRDFSRFLNRI